MLVEPGSGEREQLQQGGAQVRPSAGRASRVRVVGVAARPGRPGSWNGPLVDRAVVGRGAAAGCPRSSRRRQVIIRRPVSVTSPITVAGTSHFAQIAMKAAMLSGVTTAIMRSCDSLIRISSGPQRSGRAAGRGPASTSMPPVPLAASSVVAQETPAAPRSWMPTTTSARVQLQAALDQQLLHERVAHLDARAAWPATRPRTSPRPAPTRRRCRRRRSARRTGRPCCPARGDGQLDLVLAEQAHAERVDQGVADVAGVEDDLAADVGQAEAVAVVADALDHAGQHPPGVGRVGRAEPQRVHHRDRPGAHRHDVADDAADAGGRALVRLDVGRVVVRLDLEGGRPAVADVDDAGVLAHADQQAPGLCGGLRGRTGAGAPCDDLYEQCSLHMTE